MTAVDRRRVRGAEGERAAKAWYEADGYRVADQNWRRAGGEIDLVLTRGSTVVFCEVKTRSSDAFGSPAEAVDHRKQQRIRRLAVQWLASPGHQGFAEVRFDVVSVLEGHVEVIEHAF